MQLQIFHFVYIAGLPVVFLTLNAC